MTSYVNNSMYTTYQTNFIPHTYTSTNGQQRKSAMSTNKNSIYARQSFYSCHPQITDSSNNKIQSKSIQPTEQNKRSNDQSFNYHANVQRSGFWCENPISRQVYDKQEMKTTYQDTFGTNPNNCQKGYRNGRKSMLSNLTSNSPFIRDPIMVPTRLNDEPTQTFTTTAQESFKPTPMKQVSIPINVVLEPTGFQRGTEGKIGFRSLYQQTKLTQIEIDRLKYKDPVSYLSATNNDSPYISTNQLFYQAPIRPKPF